MARKKKHPEHVNHERWLISYADFITLLFAFFVVMFAVSQVDSKKVGRFTESFSKAVGIDMFPQPGRGLLPASEGTSLDPENAGPAKPATALPEELANLQNALVGAPPGDNVEHLQVIARRNELVLRLADNLLFDSGDDALKEPAAKVVARIAAELEKRNVNVRVEGHTDDRPIKNARFRSNWDLSTARATAVVARLADNGIAPARLSAAGYGEFHPLAPNATDDGRKQNRRVDLVVSVTPKEEP
jgi:chemotaxis protein MotB